MKRCPIAAKIAGSIWILPFQISNIYKYLLYYYFCLLFLYKQKIKKTKNKSLFFSWIDSPSQLGRRSRTSTDTAVSSISSRRAASTPVSSWTRWESSKRRKNWGRRRRRTSWRRNRRRRRPRRRKRLGQGRKRRRKIRSDIWNANLKLPLKEITVWKELDSCGHEPQLDPNRCVYLIPKMAV